MGSQKKKQKIIFLVSFIITLLLFFVTFKSGLTPKEIISLHYEERPPQMFSENPAEDKIDRVSEDSQEGQRAPTVFKAFELSPLELESFLRRREEPKDFSLDISGLEIDRKLFEVDTVEDLPETLTIPLPDGGFKEFSRHFVSFEDPNSFVWEGVSKDSPLETLHLSFYHQAIVGQVRTEQASYEIKYLSDGRNLIRKLNQSQYRENPDDVIVAPPGEKEVSRVEKKTLQVTNPETSKQIVIDIVIGYSHLIQQTEGGVSPALALIKLFIASANTAYRNSETGVVINVKNIMQLNINGSKSMGTDLKKLSDAHLMREGDEGYNSNNPYHRLMRERHQTNSDLAALFMAQAPISTDENGITWRTCGIAYLLGTHTSSSFQKLAVSVNAANCDPEVFGHEIGHNLGCQHNREIVAHPWGLSYAFGFQSTTQGLRTMMSYECSNGMCPKVLYFSDPNRQLKGGPIGEVNRIDNARAIRTRASVVKDIYLSANTGTFNIPKITKQPQSGSLPRTGTGSLDLTVIASGTDLSYQWYRSHHRLSGENKHTLKLTSLPGETTSAKYHVVIWNKNGLVRSNESTVDLSDELHLVQDLEDLTLDFNEPAQFSIQVIGYPRPQVTWYKNRRVIPGETDLTLSLGRAQWFHRGTYSAIISNSQDRLTTKEVRLQLKSENKWEPLSNHRGPSSSVELGTIDRDLGVSKNKEE